MCWVDGRGRWRRWRGSSRPHRWGEARRRRPPQPVGEAPARRSFPAAAVAGAWSGWPDGREEHGFWQTSSTRLPSRSPTASARNRGRFASSETRGRHGLSRATLPRRSPVSPSASCRGCAPRRSHTPAAWWRDRGPYRGWADSRARTRVCRANRHTWETTGHESVPGNTNWRHTQTTNDADTANNTPLPAHAGKPPNTRSHTAEPPLTRAPRPPPNPRPPSSADPRVATRRRRRVDLSRGHDPSSASSRIQRPTEAGCNAVETTASSSASSAPRSIWSRMRWLKRPTMRAES